MRLVHLHFLAPLLALSACAKGCEGPPPEVPPAISDVGQAKSDDPNRLPVERALDLQLADRRGGAILPAIQMLPYRRLTGFEVDKNFVARLDEKSLRVLDREAREERLQDEDAIMTVLRMAAQDYRERAGLEPNRLVLAVDAKVPVELTSRVRKVALKAGTWRVVALARDGEQLVELSLTPPPEHRPTPDNPMPNSLEPTPTTR
jgi:hypothetical protein